MPDLTKFYVGGQWVTPHSMQRLPVVNPATEQQFAEVALADEADVDAAVAAARSAYERDFGASKTERLKRLGRLLEATERRLEDLAQAMTQEMGAPIRMARQAQADAAVGHLKGYITALEHQQEEELLPNGDILVREPIGVCGLITPWNWPINQIAMKVIPALAAGATCILKPSEHTPLSAAIYADIIDSAGFPAGAFNLIYGNGMVAGTALARHPDIQMISFTGSTRAGRAVTKNAADTIKRVTLELGGKSPNLVFADCDLEDRIRHSVLECFYNTGQSCDAPTRLLVERSCYDEALQIAVRTAKDVSVGDPARDGEHIGPLFDRIQFDRVQHLIEDGIKEGARLLVGGPGRPDAFQTGWYVRPTIFADVDNRMRIAREEIFGPVLVIIPFDDEEHAINLANDTPYGLAAYIQTGSEERARRVASRLRAGAIHINGGSYQYGSPFGGYKQSGNGREGGRLGLEDYQELKTIHLPAAAPSASAAASTTD